MSIIRKIQGREALPVWALPYVVYNGWGVCVAFEEVLQSLAHKTYGRIVPAFLTAYKLNEDGKAAAITPIEWGRQLDYVAMITGGLKSSEGEYEYKNYPVWLDSVAKAMPTQAFVFLDELSVWYYEFIEKDVDEDDNKIQRLKLIPTGEIVEEIVTYRREDYALSLDPDIDGEVREKHKAWFAKDAEQQAMPELRPIQNADPATPEPENIKPGESILANTENPYSISRLAQSIAAKKGISSEEAMRWLIGKGYKIHPPKTHFIGPKGFDGSSFGGLAVDGEVLEPSIITEILREEGIPESEMQEYLYGVGPTPNAEPATLEPENAKPDHVATIPESSPQDASKVGQSNETASETRGIAAESTNTVSKPEADIPDSNGEYWDEIIIELANMITGLNKHNLWIQLTLYKPMGGESRLERGIKQDDETIFHEWPSKKTKKIKFGSFRKRKTILRLFP